MLVEPFCINEANLRSDNKRFLACNSSDRRMVLVFFCCGGKRRDKTDMAAQSSQYQNRTREVRTGAVLFKPDIHSKTTPPYLPFMIQGQVIIVGVSVFLDLVPLVKILAVHSDDIVSHAASATALFARRGRSPLRSLGGEPLKAGGACGRAAY